MAADAPLTRRCAHYLHHQELHWQLVLANLLLVLTNWLLVLVEEAVLVQEVESLRFQAHFGVLRRRLGPWTCASFPSVVYLAAF